MPRIVVALSLLAFSSCLWACQSSEKVIPFPEAGPACGTVGHVDCSEFPNVSCSGKLDASANGCFYVVYGCADASYYADPDPSKCELEAGVD